MTAFEVEAIRAALDKMQRQGFFSISTIDAILKVTGGVPDRRAYDALSLLHCVHYKDMNTALRLALPRMVQLVIESPPVQMPTFLPAPVVRELEVVA